MKITALVAAVLSLVPLHAQVFQFTKEQMVKYTAQNPYERFADGRPKVPDEMLKKVETMSQEEVWGVLPGKGFVNHFEGNWQLLHPGKKLVGRAFTAQFMPLRPDVGDVIEADAKAKGGTRGPNQRVIDMLQPGDVLVVDLFGKQDGGTFVGDNLATAIYALSGNGFVIDGAIRDLDGIFPLDMAAYFRSTHPSAIRNVMLTGVNVPVRIGNITVMPGDVILGDREGISIIPPHLVQATVDRAMETQVHDEWTKQKFMTKKYKSSELYSTPDDPALKKEYEEYKRKKLGK